MIRTLTLAGALAGAVSLSQFPEFSQQYLQRLSGAVDELLLYVAPSLLGDAARPLAALPGLERLADRVQLRWTDVRQLGTDLRITATPVAGQQEG